MHRRHADISERNPTSPEEGGRILREKKKSGFVLKFARVMDFFDYHINFCLFTAEPEVLILEAVSKLT